MVARDARLSGTTEPPRRTRVAARDTTATEPPRTENRLSPSDLPGLQANLSQIELCRDARHGLRIPRSLVRIQHGP